MRSLEHIIRDIREGKASKGKKSSLEHSIRKVVSKEYESSFGAKDSKPVDEDVGGLAGSGTGGEPKLHTEDGKKKKTDEAVVGAIGTDKFQGNEFKSIRTTTPHIKPPAGEGSHSQAPENASRQRSIAKERAGINRVSESKLDFADPIAKNAAELLLKVAPEAKLPAIFRPKGMPAKPKAGVPEVIPPKKAEVPAKVEPKTVVEPKTEVPAKVDTKTEPKLAAPEKVDTKTEPKLVSPEKVDTKLAAPGKEDVKLADPDVKTSPKLAAVEPAVKAAIPGIAKTAGKLAPFIPPFIGGMGSMPTKDAFDFRSKKVPVASHIHHAKRHMKEEVASELRKKIQNMPRKDAGDRKSIEYVGRMDSDPKSAKEKTSRLAIIKNVIDEAKKEKAMKPRVETESGMGKEKKFIYPNDTEVVIGPNPKNNFLDVETRKMPNDNQ
jgi:hypothetical protein